MSRTSSEVRRTSRTARRRGVIAAIGIVAALGLSGCGDDPAEPGAAAVVGDNRISVAELQSAYTELGAVAKGPDGLPLPQTALLSWLMLAPYSIPAAADAGVAVSEAQTVELLDRLQAELEASEAAARATASPSPTESPTEATPSPTASASPSPSGPPGTYSDSTVTAVRSYLSLQNVIQQLGERAPVEEWANQLYEQLEAGDPQINPRYGTYSRPDVAAATSPDDLIGLVGSDNPNWFAEVATPSPSPSPGAEGAPGEPPAEPSPTSAP